MAEGRRGASCLLFLSLSLLPQKSCRDGGRGASPNPNPLFELSPLPLSRLFTTIKIGLPSAKSCPKGLQEFSRQQRRCFNGGRTSLKSSEGLIRAHPASRCAKSIFAKMSRRRQRHRKSRFEIQVRHTEQLGDWLKKVKGRGERRRRRDETAEAAGLPKGNATR